MSPFLAMWRKELGSYFFAPVAYVVAVAFLAVAGINFWRLAAQSDVSPMSTSLMLFGPIFFWVMTILVVSVVTMRVFAEEKRMGTIECLVTAPIREEAIVLGKYAGALSFFCAVIAPTVLYIPLLRLTSSGMVGVEWGPVAGGYLVLVLSGAFYIALGLLVSSLARSQISAAIVSFALISLLFFSEYFGQILPGGMDRSLSVIATSKHAFDYSRGIVDTRSMVFYVTGAGLALFACVRVLKSNLWRG